MSTLRMFAASVAAAALFVAMPAAAVVKIATYSGTVSNGFDSTGVFGVANTDLTGASWVAVFTYDKLLGGLLVSGVGFDESYGGGGYGQVGESPVTNVAVTINGVTRSIVGDWASHAVTATSPAVAHYSEDLIDTDVTYMVHFISLNAAPQGAPASLDKNFAPVATRLDNSTTGWFAYDYASGNLTENATAILDGDAVFSVASQAPEPASWALMIAGFGMVGGALRARRMVPVRAAVRVR